MLKGELLPFINSKVQAGTTRISESTGWGSGGPIKGHDVMWIAFCLMHLHLDRLVFKDFLMTRV